MDRPVVGGGDKEYSQNYDKIFRKPLPTLRQKIENWLIKIFVEEERGQK